MTLTANLLTQRETQVAEHITRGLTNKEIALLLGLSPTTIQAHTHIIYIKLGVARRGAVARALQKEHSDG